MGETNQTMYIAPKSANEATAHYAPEPARSSTECTFILLGQYFLINTVNSTPCRHIDKDMHAQWHTAAAARLKCYMTGQQQTRTTCTTFTLQHNIIKISLAPYKSTNTTRINLIPVVSWFCIMITNYCIEDVHRTAVAEPCGHLTVSLIFTAMSI